MGAGGFPGLRQRLGCGRRLKRFSARSSCGWWRDPFHQENPFCSRTTRKVNSKSGRVPFSCLIVQRCWAGRWPIVSSAFARSVENTESAVTRAGRELN
jgi:hypothetical protein